MTLWISFQLRESLLQNTVSVISVNYKPNCPAANHDAAHGRVTIDNWTGNHSLNSLKLAAPSSQLERFQSATKYHANIGTVLIPVSAGSTVVIAR